MKPTSDHDAHTSSDKQGVVTDDLLDRRGEAAGAVIAAAFLGLGTGLFFLGSFLESRFVEALSWQFFLAVLPAVCAFVQFRVFRGAVDRKRYEEQLKKRVRSESLFEHLARVSPAERLMAVRARLSVAADVVILLVAGGLAIHFFSAESVSPNQPASGLAFCGLIAFAAFTAGKYIISLGDLSAWKPLRPAGAWSGCSGIFAFAGALAFGAAHAGWPHVSLLLDHLAPFWFLLLSLDKAAGLFGRFYAVGGPGREPGASLPVETVGAPADAGRSVGDALSYNFGITLTAAGIGRFLVRIVCPFFLASFCVFILLSCLGWVEPGSTGVVERFGRQSGSVRPPGLFFKLPWPVETVRLVDQLKTRFQVISAHNHSADGDENGGAGEAQHEHAATDQHRAGEVILWSKEHGDAHFVMTPQWGEGEKSVALLAVSASVFFKVSEPLDYAYASVDPEMLTRLLFKRALVRLAARTDPRAFFDPRRAALVGQLTTQLNRELSRYGVEVRQVTFQHVHMPVEVAPAFENVASSRAKQKSLVLGAEAEKLRKERIVQHEMETLLYQAEKRASEIRTGARKLALLSEAIAPWWADMNFVLRRRLVMEVLRSLGKEKKKIILPRNVGGVSVFEVRPEQDMFFQR